MVKQFLYRGVPHEELESMQLDDVFRLFTARQRRSLTRGITDNKRKLIGEIKAAKKAGAGGDAAADGAKGAPAPIRTHVRDLIVLPHMVGVTVNVFSGKEFVPVLIREEMIGHYLGEYVVTNKRVQHGAPGVGASRSSLYVPLK